MTTQKPILKAAAWAARILPAPIKKFFYKTPFLSKAIRRSLNAAVPEGLSEVTISAGAAGGLKMIVDLHSEKDYWLGTYETDLQTAAKALVQPGDVIYDIGANIGYVSLVFAALTGKTGRVFSVEALPDNITRLKQNIVINTFESRVAITHAAVIDSDHPVTFLTHASDAMGKALGSAGRDENYASRITVPGICLDSFVFTQGHPVPNLIKMDIEGGEGNAMAGMERILADERPILLVELHGEKAAREVWKHLRKHAYHIHRMKRGYVKVDRVNDLDWKAYIIALPEEHVGRLS